MELYLDTGSYHGNIQHIQMNDQKVLKNRNVYFVILILHVTVKIKHFIYLVMYFGLI